MNKFAKVIVGLLLLLPMIFLASGNSLVGAFFTGVLQNWIFLLGYSAVAIAILLFLNRLLAGPKATISPLTARFIGIATLWAVFIVILTVVLTNIFPSGTSADGPLNSAAAKLLTGPLRWPMILSLCLFTPITEELAFRGVIQQFISGLVGFWPATVLTALLFTVLHWQLLIPSICLFTFAMGISIMNHYSHTLATSIIAHIIYNTIVTVLVFVQL
ncbi:CPBP family intramembrane glutamic endopeptidase [Lacticaseibacillus brantae]|uniref:CPBP family intramembrane glutamic endopeptidase n=1 Tax=Lacticaseibacillus brantae TaxID=943673 RepID=UPI0012ED6CC8|nr:type II CAAX endopeptidase family protein [Lacticaseibacillus brantae]